MQNVSQTVGCYECGKPVVLVGFEAIDYRRGLFTPECDECEKIRFAERDRENNEQD